MLWWLAIGCGNLDARLTALERDVTALQVCAPGDPLPEPEPEVDDGTCPLAFGVDNPAVIPVSSQRVVIDPSCWASFGWHLDLAQAAVHLDGEGQPDGYEVQDVFDMDLRFALGLREGDLLLTVNGAPATAGSTPPDGRVHLVFGRGGTAFARDVDVAPAAFAGTCGAADPCAGIRPDGEFAYDVQRATYDAYFGNLEALQGLARAVPHRDADGEVNGYRLSGIRQNSPVACLGLHNGDIVTEVDGLPMSS